MKSSAINPHPINRIQSVLDYIHTNLDSTLSVDEISKASCWSRWQLQRVFQQHTGISVAHYIRELKLSLAAERLIHTSDRSLDIAIEMGFTSEHAFSRAFRNMFSKSPREYRKTQQLSGLRQPLTLRKTPEEEKKHQRFIEVRIETKPAFELAGYHEPIHGLFSATPDFQSKVPSLWSRLYSSENLNNSESTYFGVIDVTQAYSNNQQLEYWAGYECSPTTNAPRSTNSSNSGLDLLAVPEQTYAVITHIGKASELASTLEWFILHWLPYSNYHAIDGYELELYPEGYDVDSEQAQMQYWIPVEPNDSLSLKPKNRRISSKD
ncbi:helix-turn-helix domain-containing protein [Vibrio alginolyticus]|nr:helix-turn-helix domain-containing protein [Vibrio alginolyticus]ELA7820835.1 helix-turn-helix domain-containing protein [Vibrio alginolyticus]